MEIRGQGVRREPRDIFELLGRKEQIERMALAMRAIAHPLRLKILCVLGAHELSVQDIVEAVGTSQSNVSQHLAILRGKSILSRRKDANHVYYSVSDQRTLHLIATMREVLCGSPPRS
jgi:DNA-binding transcriptional ArsR family regulator